jgi:hypothetical protein
LPTDSDKRLTLMSFFTQSVLLAGRRTNSRRGHGQIGPIVHEYVDRPGDSVTKAAEKCAKLLMRVGARERRSAASGIAPR